MLLSKILYTRYPIVARALGLAAIECAHEQRNLAYKAKLCSIQFLLSPIFCLLRRQNLSLVFIEEIGKDVSGQDKTVLTEFQITLILYTYESL